MTLLKDLGGIPNLLSNSLLSKSSLWNREADSITQLDISLFVASHRHTDYAKALREVHILIDAGIDALIEGELEVAEFTSYEYPKAAFTATELIEWLSCVSVARRKAILFALEMRMNPREVIALDWEKLSRLQLTPLSLAIVNSCIRHIKLKYVFWDYLSNGSAAPLFGLSESVLEVSQELGYESLQSLYDRMVLFDDNAELHDFASTMEKVSGKILVPMMCQ